MINIKTIALKAMLAASLGLLSFSMPADKNPDMQMTMKMVFNLNMQAGKSATDMPSYTPTEMSFRMNVSGDKVAIDNINAPIAALAGVDLSQIRVISDKKTNETTLANVRGGKKVYTVMDNTEGKNDKKTQKKQMDELADKINKSNVVLTWSTPTDTRKIEGYNCRHIVATCQYGQMDMWVTNEMDVDWSTYRKSMNAVKTTEKLDNAIKKLMGNVPADLQKSFPLQVDFDITEPNVRRFISSASFSMGNIKKKADKTAFELKGYEKVEDAGQLLK